MNIIKLSASTDQATVNESDERNMKDISSATVIHLGSIVIPFQNNDVTFINKFDILKDLFPIPGSDIFEGK